MWSVNCGSECEQCDDGDTDDDNECGNDCTIDCSHSILYTFDSDLEDFTVTNRGDDAVTWVWHSGGADTDVGAAFMDTPDDSKWYDEKLKSRWFTRIQSCPVTLEFWHNFGGGLDVWAYVTLYDSDNDPHALETYVRNSASGTPFFDDLGSHLFANENFRIEFWYRTRIDSPPQGSWELDNIEITGAY